MVATMQFPLTRQGVRDLDHPVDSANVNIGNAERAASSMGGAFLAGLGLRRGLLRGLGLLALGGALIYRGSSDHCSAYAALGINTAT